MGVNFSPQAVCEGFPLPSSIIHTRGHLGGPFADPLAPAFAPYGLFLRHKLQLSIRGDRSLICSGVLRHSVNHGSIWGQCARTFLKWSEDVFAEDGVVTLMVPSGYQPKVLVLFWVHGKISGEKNVWDGLS